MTRACIALTVLLAAASASAQQEIRWRTDPAQAVKEAENTNKPLMVYVIASGEDRDKKVEREQRKTLTDPAVVRLAARFVTLRMSRGSQQEWLDRMHISRSANLQMYFFAPDQTLTQLADISGAGLEQPSSLIEKMNTILDSYAGQLYEKNVKPILTDAEAKPAELKKALQQVIELRPKAASADVLALLEREKLDAGTRTLTYDALAAISDPASVDKLLDLAHNNDAQAAKALEKCSPEAGATLVERLDANAEVFDYVAYKAVTKIFGISNVKPDTFFQKAKSQFKEQEIERIKGVVAQKMQGRATTGGPGQPTNPPGGGRGRDRR